MNDGTPRRLARRSFLKGALASASLLAVGSSLLRPGLASASGTGPSTTTEPYLVPSVPGVQLVSILTVGDVAGGYRMVGIPDGLGAFPSGPHHFTLMMNHELTATSGIVRGHGSKGAFVSRWTIDRRTLEVVEGQDFTRNPLDVHRWDVAPRATCPARRCGSGIARPTSRAGAPSTTTARARWSAST